MRLTGHCSPQLVSTMWSRNASSGAAEKNLDKWLLTCPQPLDGVCCGGGVVEVEGRGGWAERVVPVEVVHDGDVHRPPRYGRQRSRIRLRNLVVDDPLTGSVRALGSHLAAAVYRPTSTTGSQKNSSSEIPASVLCRCSLDCLNWSSNKPTAVIDLPPIGTQDVEYGHSPVAPSIRSRMMSAWPLCRAYSPINLARFHRTLLPLTRLWVPRSWQEGEALVRHAPLALPGVEETPTSSGPHSMSSSAPSA